ncbi:MAG: hypothetical protein Q7J31_07390 [Syntrophales bacterium]|nr:hypothetical protein [Syntrophales bacterium]
MGYTINASDRYLTFLTLPSNIIETGKALLREYLNATESIADIARELQVNEKSLRRMLGPKGNPTLKNFLSLLKVCSSVEHLTLQVSQH